MMRQTSMSPDVSARAILAQHLFSASRRLGGERALAIATARVGTCGWAYPHWVGAFYPEGLRARDRFAHYASAFDTVEIDNTFYRLPERSTFLAWRRAAPEGFVYALKASRLIIHLKRLRDVREPLGVFLARARLLKGRLGPVLYQLPPNVRKNLPLLVDFLALLPGDLRHAVEFRHESWYDEEVREAFERAGAALCVHDRADCPSPRWATAPFVYCRFHGAGQSEGGLYGPRRLRSWARWLVERLDEGRDVHAYFNNDAGGGAVRDALALRRMLNNRKQAIVNQDGPGD